MSEHGHKEGYKHTASDKNILIAFLLNLFFSVFEFIGGLLTNSVSIMSDSVHDLGDVVSIGFSYVMERKSKKKANSEYTYGYVRYSVFGSIVTAMILLVGSLFVFYNVFMKASHPEVINYDGMILLAVIGCIVNFIAARVTHEHDSLNSEIVSLHMLEDVGGWLIVLVVGVIMKFTNMYALDYALSSLLSFFVAFKAGEILVDAVRVVAERIPKGITVEDVKASILEVKGVKDVHHLHVWSLDGVAANCATMHVVSDNSNGDVKKDIREKLKEKKILHVTIEIEDVDEVCESVECDISEQVEHEEHHHHKH